MPTSAAPTSTSARARRWTSGLLAKEGADTTHLTAADGKGNVVATTQTINSLFGARFIVPGLGMVPNDYMSNFDPRPGNALSIAPGKRVTTSMAPMMALRDGRLVYALGLPGGRKIFPSAWQALINLLDHGMALQEAVEAPRIWTEGPVLEVEHGIPEKVRQGLSERGHKLQVMPTVAGGMNAIQFHDDGSMTGAACWRADGSPVALGGGLARPGVRFVLPGVRAAGLSARAVSVLMEPRAAPSKRKRAQRWSSLQEAHSARLNSSRAECAQAFAG